ncbi:hypothetical protein [Sphingopyxis bauzanensis]|uniref:hypothetical protein n=1 Tax=Sphingopyxis bauzanensis TaxID=651663 RepID=UPI001E63A77B|nr:hypothetical protein [Sphingopyxis bauzanensis]
MPVRVHFHNTDGTGLTNVWAAVGEGASTVVSWLGGVDGCPFAPGAAGNVPTENVVYMLERSGLRPGSTCKKRSRPLHGWRTRWTGRCPPWSARRPPFLHNCPRQQLSGTAPGVQD